jgi:lipopolysaccharide export system protein LptA
MKTLILLGGLTLFVSLKNVLIAQENNKKVSIKKSDTYSLTSNGKISILVGNVAITSDKLEVAKADKVVIDNETNKVSVVGYAEFSFKGKLIVVPSTDSRQKTLEYTVGEDVAYIK